MTRWGPYFFTRSLAPSDRNSPTSETRRYGTCRVIPSSLQRSPTFVSFCPIAAIARRPLAGVILNGRPPVLPSSPCSSCGKPGDCALRDERPLELEESGKDSEAELPRCLRGVDKADRSGRNSSSPVPSKSRQLIPGAVASMSPQPGRARCGRGASPADRTHSPGHCSRGTESNKPRPPAAPRPHLSRARASPPRRSLPASCYGRCPAPRRSPCPTIPDCLNARRVSPCFSAPLPVFIPPSHPHMVEGAFRWLSTTPTVAPHDTIRGSGRRL